MILKVAKLGVKTAVVDVDVADEKSCKAMVESTVKQFGRLDILINNAGMNIRKPAVEIPLEDWNRVVAINLTSAFSCARVAARHMIAGGEGGDVFQQRR